jgi:hypothetical protein
MAAGGHVAEKCANCGSTATNRLYLHDCDALQCEACLLDRCLQPHGATLTIEGLYGRFVEALTETLDIRERKLAFTRAGQPATPWSWPAIW